MERNTIFRDDQDKEKFMERLGNILIKIATKCYEWAFLSNHAHISCTSIARQLNIGPSAVSKAVIRGLSALP
ncbi:MAG: hypothetical protein QGG48_08190 [Desulfatiglandales bacterium]|jgi:hypothetical protein|nr:hypothetical protein [Desulfatiglandales bacterium]